METERIEVYSHATNSCIVRMPERRFPGVVIQGDSLFALFDTAMTLVERLERNTGDETFLGALGLAHALEVHLLTYEATLGHHGIALPYSRDPARNTERFQQYWSATDT